MSPMLPDTGSMIRAGSEVTPPLVPATEGRMDTKPSVASVRIWAASEAGASAGIWLVLPGQTTWSDPEAVRTWLKVPRVVDVSEAAWRSSSPGTAPAWGPPKPSAARKFSPRVIMRALAVAWLGPKVSTALRRTSVRVPLREMPVPPWLPVSACQDWPITTAEGNRTAVAPESCSSRASWPSACWKMLSPSLKRTGMVVVPAERSKDPWMSWLAVASRSASSRSWD